MSSLFSKTDEFLDLHLGASSRVLLLLAALLLVAVYMVPLWNLTMFAPQYPNGLRLDIYSYKLVGGNGGQDLREINLLNHYIGMKDLSASDFTEFKWIPFVVGMLGLLFLRAAVLGRMTHLVDAFVLYIYFGLFSLGSFAYKLYSYGHDLAPTAPVRVQPFMPPIFGHQKIANFDVYSFPKLASYMLTLSAVALGMSVLLAWQRRREELA